MDSVIEEIWNDIIGYKYLYQISSNGNIKSLKKLSSSKEFIMRTYIDRNGYECISLTSKNIKKKYKIHRLVAIAFIPNPENKTQVNHKDGIKTNNIYTNLEWSTPYDNIQHAIKNKLRNNNNNVLQFSLDNILIKKHISLSQASVSVCGRVNGKTNIGYVCRGKRKTAYNFKWEYE